MPRRGQDLMSPDPEDALDVLAFVLCPASVFAPGGDAEDLRAAQELIKPAKAEAVRRWACAEARRQQS